MEFKRVTSRENELIKRINLLNTSAKARKKEGLFVVEGLRLLSDCLENSVEFFCLVVSDGFIAKNEDWVNKFGKISANLVAVPDSLYEKISDTKSPQGVLALIKMPESKENIIDKNGKYIALENIADPSNLGAISRTAEALGISGILLSGGCDPYNPKALRASMGTLLRMPVITLNDFVNDLNNSGLSLYACVVSGGTPIPEITFYNGSAVLIGNEASGLSDNAQKICTAVTIPMRGSAESLNAAAAAAIAMWELIK